MKKDILNIKLVEILIISGSQGNKKSNICHLSNRCDAPKPRGLLTNRQPAETCGYQVARYHTTTSHLPLPVELIIGWPL